MHLLPAGVLTTNTGHHWMELLCPPLDLWICASKPWGNVVVGYKTDVQLFHRTWFMWGMGIALWNLVLAGEVGAVGLFMQPWDPNIEDNNYSGKSVSIQTVFKVKTKYLLVYAQLAMHQTRLCISIGHNWIYSYGSWSQCLFPYIIGSWISFWIIIAAFVSFLAGRRSSSGHGRSSPKHQYQA